MKNFRNLVVISVAIVMIASTVYIANAQSNATPKVLPSTSQIKGLTYGEWLARWWQFVLEVPTPDNPLTNGTDSCIFKRFGNVGVVVANSSTGGQVNCEVPAGIFLYIEVLGAECSNLEEAPFYGGNEEELRECAQALIPQNLVASIDNFQVTDLDRFIFLSPVFEFINPEENILGVPAGTSGLSMGLGSYLMIAPLSPGKHTIHVQGMIPTLEYTRDVVIDLTVSR
ncbi:MAG: hypothetical protein ACYDH1_00680 [Anaerolineaceae bacterium]